jgi:two-component system, cell cycle response regulator
VVAFAFLNLSFLRAEVARIRFTAKGRIEKELLRLKDDARRYRLLGAGEAQKQDDKSEDRLARSSVEEIHEAVHYALDLMRRTLHLHTAVLLWLNEAGTHLRISELSTASDEVHDAPFPAGDGVIGAAVLQRQKVSLTGLKPSYKVPYYTGACPVRSLTALPLMEGDTLNASSFSSSAPRSSRASSIAPLRPSARPSVRKTCSTPGCAPPARSPASIWRR